MIKGAFDIYLLLTSMSYLDMFSLKSPSTSSYSFLLVIYYLELVIPPGPTYSATYGTGEALVAGDIADCIDLSVFIYLLFLSSPLLLSSLIRSSTSYSVV